MGGCVTIDKWAHCMQVLAGILEVASFPKGKQAKFTVTKDNNDSNSHLYSTFFVAKARAQYIYFFWCFLQLYCPNGISPM